MRRLHRIVMSSLALVAAAAMTACSTDGPDAGPDAQETTAAARSGGDDGDDQAAEGSAEAAGFDTANMPDPVSSQEIPAVVEDDPDATMTVDFYGLERGGATVTARFAFTVDAESDEPRWLYHYLGDSGWSPYLIDTQNLRKHSVLSGSGQSAQTAYQGAMFRPGQTFYAFAVFAAPDDGVDTVSVAPVEGAQLIPDVQIP